MNLLAKKNELQSLTKGAAGEKKDGGVQAKVIQEEIEETNGQLRELKVHLDNSNTKMISLVKRRDGYAGEWRSAGHKDLAVELLGHILKENIILVENLEF